MHEPLRILMLEDLQDDVGLVKRALRKAGIEAVIQQVDQRGDYETALVSFEPDVILSDHALPAFNSIEALELKTRLTPAIPFILVTGAVSEEFAAQCIRQGADDYVLKTNLTRLPVAIRNAIEAKVMQEKRMHDARALETQNDELVKVNSEMDAFIYSLSHGLRSPLSSILGLVNLARIELPEAPSRNKSYLEMIEASVKKLDLTIKEMVDYSRNARVELNLEQLDLQQLIQESINSLEYIKGFTRIDKRISVHKQAQFVGDRFRTQVIINGVLSNAIKFADHKKSDQHVVVRASITDAEAEILVEDNGVGVKEELLPHIFKMFYRGNDKVDGAGLGLFVAREVAHKLGAHVSLRSVEGQGTSVTIRIPNQTIENVKH